MKKIYTFEEILKMDHHLLQLAIYETSKGSIFIPKSHEDLARFQIEYSKTFNYFKNLIRNGEASFEDLKYDVANRWGPVEQKYLDTNDIDRILKDIELNESKNFIRSSGEEYINKILETIFLKKNSSTENIKITNTIKNEKQKNKRIKKGKKNT